MEATGVKGVIFPTFVYGPNVPMGCRFIVRDTTISFPNLEGSQITLIVETQDKG